MARFWFAIFSDCSPYFLIAPVLACLVVLKNNFPEGLNRGLLYFYKKKHR